MGGLTTSQGLGTLIGALLGRGLAAYGAGTQEDALRRYIENANSQLGTPTANAFNWNQGQDLSQAAETPQAAQPAFPVPDRSSFLQRFLAPGASTQSMLLEAGQAARQMQLAQALQQERQRIALQSDAEQKRQQALIDYKNAHPSAAEQALTQERGFLHNLFGGVLNQGQAPAPGAAPGVPAGFSPCLLYTSDAADE